MNIVVLVMILSFSPPLCASFMVASNDEHNARTTFLQPLPPHKKIITETWGALVQILSKKMPTITDKIMADAYYRTISLYADLSEDLQEYTLMTCSKTLISLGRPEQPLGSVDNAILMLTMEQIKHAKSLQVISAALYRIANLIDRRHLNAYQYAKTFFEHYRTKEFPTRIKDSALHLLAHTAQFLSQTKTYEKTVKNITSRHEIMRTSFVLLTIAHRHLKDVHIYRCCEALNCITTLIGTCPLAERYAKGALEIHNQSNGNIHLEITAMQKRLSEQEQKTRVTTSLLSCALLPHIKATPQQLRKKKTVLRLLNNLRNETRSASPSDKKPIEVQSISNGSVGSNDTQTTTRSISPPSKKTIPSAEAPSQKHHTLDTDLQ